MLKLNFLTAQCSLLKPRFFVLEGRLDKCELNLLATVDEVDVIETLHADDGEKVIDEDQNKNRRCQPGVENDSSAKDVTEATLHPKKCQEPAG